MVYKSLHNLAPPYLEESFKLCEYSYKLRSQGNVVLPKPRTESCRRMFSYRGSRQYNNLPSNIKLSNNFNSFCNLLNKRT